jgi:osmotically-inducible protein OsmY
VDNDKELQAAVMRELEWDPQVDAANIGVTASDGAVTLTGFVSSYAEKTAAVRAAERVYGVKAVADEIKVSLPDASVRGDAELAEEIARELRWNTLVPDTVKAEVRNGWVTLRGEVEWAYQRDASERAVRTITGVAGVSNQIAIKPREEARLSEVEMRVAEAIKRMADLDAHSIWATKSNGTVHLHGTVHSLYERRLAEEAAKSAPGVTKVDNEIAVVP